MSIAADTLAGIRRILLMDAEIERMKLALGKTETELLDHERRLIRIETLIDLARTRRLPE